MGCIPWLLAISFQQSALSGQLSAVSEKQEHLTADG